MIEISNCLLSDGLKYLEYLSLRSIKMTGEGFYSLTYAIRSKKIINLHTLIISNNFIESGGIKNLINSVNQETCPVLRSLDLSYNIFDQSTINQLSLLKQILPSLISLKCESINYIYIRKRCILRLN